MTDWQVMERLDGLGVSRITHFTSSRNLPRILGSGELLSTAALLAGGVAFERTDPLRLDNRLDHICCNIEYPNFYYFTRATQRENAVNYSDWAALLLNPAVAAREGTLFAPGNAAKNSGRDIQAGLAGLEAQYAPTVYSWSRSSNHRRESPTDVQAEVLIPGAIDVSEVLGIVVPDEPSLRREVGRLEQVGHNPHQFGWYVSPGYFQRDAIVSAVRQSYDIPISGPRHTDFEETS